MLFKKKCLTKQTWVVKIQYGEDPILFRRKEKGRSKIRGIMHTGGKTNHAGGSMCRVTANKGDASATMGLKVVRAGGKRGQKDLTIEHGHLEVNLNHALRQTKINFKLQESSGVPILILWEKVRNVWQEWGGGECGYAWLTSAGGGGYPSQNAGANIGKSNNKQRPFSGGNMYLRRHEEIRDFWGSTPFKKNQHEKEANFSGP